jgi:hypothetical protein
LVDYINQYSNDNKIDNSNACINKNAYQVFNNSQSSIDSKINYIEDQIKEIKLNCNYG